MYKRRIVKVRTLTTPRLQRRNIF